MQLLNNPILTIIILSKKGHGINKIIDAKVKGNIEYPKIDIKYKV